MKLFYTALQRRDEFDRIAESIDDFFQSTQENPDIRADLAEYVKEIEVLSKPHEKIIEDIDATEHAKFIQQICIYLILKKDSKTNAVMIHGAHSAGKTQFLHRLK